ncbi:MAG TPA: CRISPR-associated endonuclease Cas2 [Burkholderiaceae bacterium]|nr:CRISPR-associated endonuclease Cas2 [Burkholderiaceae bacterium]HOS87402.1 CRISPR-associated endonuclease Cas2 [Burkholderiaceae bacterium]HPL79276.1 CRISPR-associated endonuclease Cas2 [Burkholderiaceae bacterium]
MEQTWLVTYDVSDDGRRRRVERILLGHGEREQYSVFRCRLSPREVRDLRARLIGHLKGSDSIRYYPLCAACLPRQPQRTLLDSAEAGMAGYFAV